MKAAVSICYILQEKFKSEMETIDGLALIKKARLHIQKQELMDALNKVKI